MIIALICGSNMLYMPYVSNYEKILKESDADFTIINWDRFQIEENDEFKYRDAKIGHQRNFYDYYRYKNFILKKLSATKYDKLIIFGLPLSCFLKNYLMKCYKGKHIIDIRDYNKIIKFFNVKKVVDNSVFTVLSSPEYKEWLPNSDKYIINYNTTIKSVKELKSVNIKSKNDRITISCIGAIRDYDVNIAFINSLKNNDSMILYYHGEGNINGDIRAYLTENNIKNVLLTGRYKKKDEEELYTKSDFINILIPTNDINSKTLLPNRLYNAALHGKPIIGLKGTYLSKQIKKYRLGLVLDSFDKIESKIQNYIKGFDENLYEKGRHSFFEEIINDNEYFVKKLKEFVGV